MALVPDDVERKTPTVGISIYKYAAAKWHEMINAMADLIDAAFSADRSRMDGLDVRLDNAEAFLATNSPYVPGDPALDVLGLTGAFGDVGVPLLHMPLKNSLVPVSVRRRLPVRQRPHMLIAMVLLSRPPLMRRDLKKKGCSWRG